MISKKIILSALVISLFAPTLVFGETAATDQANTNVRPEPKPAVDVRLQEKNIDLPLDPAVAEKIRRAKMFAEQEIERRMKALASTTEKVQGLDRVSDAFKAELRAKLEATKQSIQTLRLRIASSTDAERVKGDVESINREHRSFALVVPKAYIAAAAEKVVTITAIMGEMGVKLKNRIDAAEAEGKDVEALQEALISLSAHIDAANGYARTAVESTANLSTDNEDQTVFEANKAALKAAREALAAAHQEIQGGRQDIKLITDAFKAAAQSANVTEDTTEPTPVE